MTIEWINKTILVLLKVAIAALILTLPTKMLWNWLTSIYGGARLNGAIGTFLAWEIVAIVMMIAINFIYFFSFSRKE